MVEAFHHKQLPLEGVVGLVEESAGGWHLWIFKDGIPPRLLVLEPAPHPLAVGWSSGGGDMVHKAAEPLPQRKHPQALALACPVPQGVALRAQRLAHRGRDGHQFLRELKERVAQADAYADARKERPHTLDGAVETIGQDSPDAIRGLLLIAWPLITRVNLTYPVSPR